MNLKASFQKMKFLFKHYLEFEKSRGSPGGNFMVMEKARAYVEAQMRKQIQIFAFSAKLCGDVSLFYASLQ